MQIRHRFEAIDNRMALMGAMCDRLGIDLVRAAGTGRGQLLTRAIRTCLGCQATAACAGWLEAGGTDAERARFCPNATLLEEMRR
jgi:Family of unknown function (DUF6455)